MFRFKNASLKRKQVIIIMLTTTTALLLACLAFGAYEVITFRKDMLGDLKTLADVMGDNCAASIDFSDPKTADETLSALKAQSRIVAAFVYTKDGKVFASYDRPNDGRTIAAPSTVSSGHQFKDGDLMLFEPISYKGETIGTIYIVSDTGALSERLREYGLITGVIFLLTLMFAFLLSARLQRRMWEPLQHLVQTARSVARDRNYSIRAIKQNHDETGMLIDGFNEMLSQIQERDAALQKAQAMLEKRVEERTGELVNSVSLLNATLESTADGILVADGSGKVTQSNENFMKMWRIPREVMDSRDDQKMLETVLSQLTDPQQFLNRVKELYEHPDLEGFDVIDFKDGRVFERYAKPQRMGDKHVGRVWSFRDITERKRAEATVRRMEELYRRAISGAGAVPYSYNYKTRTYGFVGDGIEQLIGYTPAELSPALWNEIIKDSVMLGETAGLNKHEAAQRVNSGDIKRWRCDMRIVTRAGKTRWISDASVQTVDETGEPTGSVGILEDITERKQAEIYAVAFSKLGRNLVSANTPQDAAHCVATAADELFGWYACAFYLYSPETDKTTPVLDIDTFDGRRENVYSNDESGAPPSKIDRRVIEHGAELVLKDPSVSEAGSIPYGNMARYSACIMRVPVRIGDRVAGILNVHSYTPNAYGQKDLDVLQTLADYCGAALERIRAESALRKSESQFRVVWNSSVDAMRLTNSRGIIIQVNEAYCRLTKKAKEELEGQPLSVVYHSADTQSSMEWYHQNFLAKETHPHVEKEAVLWNGEKLWVEISSSPVEMAGQEPLLLGIARDISGRKQSEARLKKVNEELLTTSRMAGMAEVATSVLHNVGNVLNSVNISASLVSEKVRNSKVANLAKVVSLIQAHAADLSAFFSKDPKGLQLPGYLEKLAARLGEEQAEMSQELTLLCGNVEHIKEIVAMQQSYAKVSGVVETLSASDLVEDALRMNAGALERHQVRVIREFTPMDPIQVEKHKVLQILINLIRNAKYAVDDNKDEDKRLVLGVSPEGNGFVRISVVDNGMGIPAENLTRIFSNGFTTRKEGHGFGLHSGALAAKELGGSLSVHSDGPGKGAAFTLILPLNRN